MAGLGDGRGSRIGTRPPGAAAAWWPEEIRGGGNGRPLEKVVDVLERDQVSIEENDFVEFDQLPRAQLRVNALKPLEELRRVRIGVLQRLDVAELPAMFG